ncbi:14.9 kDa protein [Human adenovirus 16]|uniref:14.9 kDa protein n=1 Tax=Human adenovirus B serotype 16 TaxID=31544 RepID=Q2KRV6_ADE16|nr:14.9 kDa protein [Human adenovirus 16]
MLRHFLGLFKTMQAMLPVILILLLPCIALASTATRATPEQLRKCKFQQPWSFLDCYHEKSDFPTYWIVIVGIINILSCTFFSITIYPTFNFGWNSPNALGYPQEPHEHIPLQHIQQPLALVEYENEPQPSLPPAISYFNLTGGDD